MRLWIAALLAALWIVPAYATESVEGYSISAYPFMVDADGNLWTQGGPGGTGQGNNVLKNGSVITGAYTHFMYYHNHTVYWQQNDGTWYYLNGTTVTQTTDPRQQQSQNCTGTVWCDDFNSLDAGQHMDTAHKWDYAAQWNTQWDGYNVGAGRMINPLYSGTTGSQFSNLYKTDGSGDLVLGINSAGSCTSACANEPFISGQLISPQTVSVGSYVEARVKTTATSGANFAVWLYGDYSGSGGVAQEIDLLEDIYLTSGGHAATQTLHHNPSGAQEQWADWGIDMTQWHTVGAYWTATSVCFYIDRVQTGCNSASVTDYTGAMWIYLSSQDGGSWTGGIPTGTTMPASMTIDYVRVYDHKPF